MTNCPCCGREGFDPLERCRGCWFLAADGSHRFPEPPYTDTPCPNPEGHRRCVEMVARMQAAVDAHLRSNPEPTEAEQAAIVEQLIEELAREQTESSLAELRERRNSQGIQEAARRFHEAANDSDVIWGMTQARELAPVLDPRPGTVLDNLRRQLGVGGDPDRVLMSPGVYTEEVFDRQGMSREMWDREIQRMQESGLLPPGNYTPESFVGGRYGLPSPDPSLRGYFYKNEGEVVARGFDQIREVRILRRLYALEQSVAKLEATFGEDIKSALHHADLGDVRNTSRILRNVLDKLGKVPRT